MKFLPTQRFETIPEIIHRTHADVNDVCDEIRQAVIDRTVEFREVAAQGITLWGFRAINLERNPRGF